MSPEKDTIYHYLYKQIAYCKIPDFQRPYSWADTQIKSFCQDVEETVAGTKKHNFGTPEMKGALAAVAKDRRMSVSGLLTLLAVEEISQSEDVARAALAGVEVK